MAQQVLSISQISEYIRTKIENDPGLNAVAVRGEISNYKVYPSGHHYFTLKDEGAALKCVMFKGNSLRLRFRPDNGMKVIAIGKISVYPRDGVYQLYCTSMAMDGIGDLYAAFEQMKAKLAKEGLFNPEHKKQLPRYPETIGIITSSAGAAIHDILRILNKRYPMAKVRLLPVRVQGAEAPGEIAAAIRYANHFNLADLLIVGRGGGSIEDLWAFNEEVVARAIFASRIPVISAVGHEPDVTISDYVADLRAATPSNAAELAVPDQNMLRQILDSFSETITVSLSRKIRAGRQQLSLLGKSQALQSPQGYIELRRKSLSYQTDRLISAQKRSLGEKRRRYIASVAKLDAMSPLKVLSRGYSLVQKDDGAVLYSIDQVEAGERIQVFLSDGKLSATVMGKDGKIDGK